MVKGACIALVCLVLGGFFGHRLTVMQMESIAKAYVSGQAAKK